MLNTVAVETTFQLLDGLKLSADGLIDSVIILYDITSCVILQVWSVVN